MFQKRICTKIVSLLLVIGCLMSEPVLAEKQKEPEAQTLYSKSCAMVDGDSGRLLYGKEAQTALPNASTTKILTCIVAMEQCKPDEVVTFSTKAASQPKVHLGAKKGEQFYMQDLWYGLMLESYNDCAYAIAEHVAGSAEKFAALMNEKAKKIGCTDSHFVTPNGLDAKDEHGEHHTTAYDLCRIMSYCAWKSPVSKQFLEVTQTRSHTFQSLEGTGYAVSNKNALLDMMDHVITGKTGYTSKAGYCYVAALEEGGRHYAIALLACGWPNHKNYKWSDAKTLFYHLVDISGPDYFAENQPNISFFVQAARELGYYGYDTKPFRKYLTIDSSRGYLNRIMLPKELVDKVEYRPELYHKVYDFLRDNDPKMIFIYGEVDPWSATRVPIFKGKVNEQVYIQPGGSHRARIGNMPEDMKEKILTQINKWLAE